MGRKISMKDKAIRRLILKEEKRQNETISLIASENLASPEVLKVLGSVFTNKYAEGYPSKRYYGGQTWVDEVERLAQERALRLFGLSSKKWRVNAQPYSGSPANLAIYFALVPKEGKIMGMRLDMGGHLTHGHKASLTGKLWKQVSYGVDKKTERLNYDSLMRLAKKEKPDLIVAGYSAYPRKINFKKFREIADKSGSLLMADISHIAGLIVGGVHPSPFPYADVVMTTTHKTLRGPRSAVIFSRLEHSDKIDKIIFPGLQGGPHINQIAAVATAFSEANTSEFKQYIAQVVKNARVLAKELKNKGWRIISGGTDNHLLLIDIGERGVFGKEASNKREMVGIVVNKNAIPYDVRSPLDPSGIRLGTALITTRGMKEREMKKIAGLINHVLLGKILDKEARIIVKGICNRFPIKNGQETIR